MDRKSVLFSVEDIVMEYTVVGQGVPVFIMHGGHSNCYEEFGVKALVDNGFCVIIPSRAGYGKTSKEIGSSLSVACHYYLELLNHLEIEKIHLLAVSAGGPSAIRFAAMFPERVLSLTLQSAVTKQWHTTKDKEYKIAQVIFRHSIEKYTWKLVSLMSNYFPNFMFKQFVPSFSLLSYDEVMKKMNEEDIQEFKKMNKRQRSGYGFLVDLIQNNKVSSRDLTNISCPTLIMHSKYDGAVPLDHAQYAHAKIPHSELFILESWGHLIWIGNETEAYNDTLIEFLNSNEKIRTLD